MDTMPVPRARIVGRARPGGRGRSLAPRVRTTEMRALDWQLAGACRTETEELFFGPVAIREERREKSRRIREAKRVCARCPVWELCRGYALENEEEFGVWGGLSELERWELINEQRVRRR
ncbi:WhiB family transcriptional regulator [Actinospica robiniae]|uniref:WhiB family transcriptional regulator n=1 Tax=Actinospica robiniae TaxID=304901 RepID=UPI00040CD145